MSRPTVNQPDVRACAGYAGVIADVSHLTKELQRTVDAARRCGQPEQTGALVNLHNRARGIAARLNQALADGHLAEGGE